MRASLTNDSIAWLSDHQIFFHHAGRERLRPGDRLQFGDDLELEPYTGFFAGNGLCPMGFMSYTQSHLSPELSVGRFCSIGHDVDFILQHHPLDQVTTAPVTQNFRAYVAKRFTADTGVELPVGGPVVGRAPPVVEHDVWIGAHASILPGVRIGSGAIVAANSVVTHSVRPYEIVAGNPARVVRRRFPDEVVKMLLATGWWRYRLADIRDLPFDDPIQFAETFLKRKRGLEPYSPTCARLAEMPRA